MTLLFLSNYSQDYFLFPFFLLAARAANLSFLIANRFLVFLDLDFWGRPKADLRFAILFYVKNAQGVGLEPTTNWLTANCSAD